MAKQLAAALQSMPPAAQDSLSGGL